MSYGISRLLMRSLQPVGSTALQSIRARHRVQRSIVSPNGDPLFPVYTDTSWPSAGVAHRSAPWYEFWVPAIVTLLQKDFSPSNFPCVVAVRRWSLTRRLSLHKCLFSLSRLIQRLKIHWLGESWAQGFTGSRIDCLRNPRVQKFPGSSIHRCKNQCFCEAVNLEATHKCLSSVCYSNVYILLPHCCILAGQFFILHFDLRSNARQRFNLTIFRSALPSSSQLFPALP
jgi:hypothetical protein